MKKWYQFTGATALRIKEWIKDIDSLANIAKTEPQLAYAAYVYGMSKRWMFLSRTTPCIAEEM